MCVNLSKPDLDEMNFDSISIRFDARTNTAATLRDTVLFILSTLSFYLFLNF